MKTATTKFPMDHFKHHDMYKEQGDHHVLTACINGHPYIACGWSDSTRKHFISTHNTTLEGNPHGKRHWREIDSDDISGTEVCIRYTKRPKVVEDYIESAKVVDVHNHARQAGLSLETAWNTQRCDHRVLSTLLGIIETDAHHMWYAFHPQGKSWSHADFTEGIAEALLAFETGSKTRLKTTLAKHSSDRIDNCDARGLPHDFQPLNALPQYAGKKKHGTRVLRRCSNCSSLASYYCTVCSNVEQDKIVSVCGLASKRPGSVCIVKHTLL